MVAISLLILALAVSLDSFNAGFTYGLRNIKIPVKSILVIACCSALALLGATAAGGMIQSLLSQESAEKIGGIVFLLLGIWILYQFFRQDSQDKSNHKKTIVNLEIKSLGLVIQILKKPVSADFDRSGEIAGIEAFMLGLALSLDAAGAGIGAALIGLNPLALALMVAVMSSLFVYLGMRSGTWLGRWKIVQKLSFLPGLLLILMGIWKI
ncbi:MAG: sporulation membrane protein YtaF [Bacillales bacterium]